MCVLCTTPRIAQTHLLCTPSNTTFHCLGIFLPDIHIAPPSFQSFCCVFLQFCLSRDSVPTSRANVSAISAICSVYGFVHRLQWIMWKDIWCIISTQVCTSDIINSMSGYHSEPLIIVTTTSHCNRSIHPTIAVTYISCCLHYSEQTLSECLLWSSKKLSKLVLLILYCW